MVTAVRRRRAWDTLGRRGRASDVPWRYRRLLTCNLDRLSLAQRARLEQILAADTELAVVWGIKEHVRQLLATRTTAAFQSAWDKLANAVKATKMAEAKSLFRTLKSWRRELLTFCRTRVTNARTEAANLGAKTVKRIARGFRNHANYRARILILVPAKVAA